MKTLSRILLDTAVAGVVVIGIIACGSSIGNPIWLLLMPFAVCVLVLALLAIAGENGRTEHNPPKDTAPKTAAHSAGRAH